MLTQAQDSRQLSLEDLSDFSEPGENWNIAGQVSASLDKKNLLHMTEGTGILVNNPGNKARGKDLFIKDEHGDIDLELDYMMAKGSNSGIYLQGRYEVQLRDSWSVQQPTSGDNGGIYAGPDYPGHAPRQNAGRAPGLWQHLEISFQAPRFDAGKKIENARILRVELNGVTIHEDVELMGPTRGAIGSGEVAQGPLRLQGDHGPVAFRNIRFTRYDRTAPSLADLRFKMFEGEFEELPDFDTLSVVNQGPSEMLTTHLPGLSAQFLLRYEGILSVEGKGEYRFNFNASGGSGQLLVNGTQVIPFQGKKGGTITLPEGEVPIEVIYAKTNQRTDPAFRLTVSGQGLREHSLSKDLPGDRALVDPIYVDAAQRPLLRSFRDLPGGTRLTHAISVGSPDKVHYTYDLKRGNLIQVWRGNFLDATPMWHKRGDGSTRPNGMVETLIEEPALFINKLEPKRTAWTPDTTGSGFRPNGYRLDRQGKPIFRYRIYDTDVRDKIRLKGEGRGLQRTITFGRPGRQLYFRLAVAPSIHKEGKNRYLIGDHSYYIQLEETGGARPILRTIGDHQELLVPVRKTLTYSILF